MNKTELNVFLSIEPVKKTVTLREIKFDPLIEERWEDCPVPRSLNWIRGHVDNNACSFVKVGYCAADSCISLVPKKCVLMLMTLGLDECLCDTWDLLNDNEARLIAGKLWARDLNMPLHGATSYRGEPVAKAQLIQKTGLCDDISSYFKATKFGINRTCFYNSKEEQNSEQMKIDSDINSQALQECEKLKKKIENMELQRAAELKSLACEYQNMAKFAYQLQKNTVNGVITLNASIALRIKEWSRKYYKEADVLSDEAERLLPEGKEQEAIKAVPDWNEVDSDLQAMDYKPEKNIWNTQYDNYGMSLRY